MRRWSAHKEAGEDGWGWVRLWESEESRAPWLGRHAKGVEDWGISITEYVSIVSELSCLGES